MEKSCAGAPGRSLKTAGLWVKTEAFRLNRVVSGCANG